MKRTLIASLLGLALVAAGGDVLAQKKRGGGGGGRQAEATPAGGAPTGAKVKSYDFSGDEIEGELIKPDGVDVTTRRFAEHTSLIRVRQDFIKEIVKSAEDL